MPLRSHTFEYLNPHNNPPVSAYNCRLLTEHTHDWDANAGCRILKISRVIPSYDWVNTTLGWDTLATELSHGFSCPNLSIASVL